MKLVNVFFLGMLLLVTSCNDDAPKLAPVDERVEAAIDELVDELTAPVNGWKLLYQPTPESGFYLMFLDFNDNGLVHILSDLADNDGEFLNQTLQYRVDSGLGLELIMETYGAFHYLFEQDFASFGAEFEFIYSRKDGNNLIFESKTDTESTRTQLTFIPATADEESLLAGELATNFNTYDGNRPRIFGGIGSIQQIIFHDQNFTLFWEIDIPKRTIEIDMAGVGTDLNSILANTDNVILDHRTAYSFSNERLILTNPVTFNLRGQEYTISEIHPTSIEMTGNPVCSSNAVATPVMTGDAGSLGSITVLRSTFDSDGLAFQPLADEQYAVNAFFIFTDDPISLQEDGSIGDLLPGTLALFFNYGFVSEEGIPANAVGLLVEDDQRNRRTIYREFEPTMTVGNRIQITFTDNFFVDGVAELNDEQSLRVITDEIFQSGEIDIYDLPLDGDDTQVYHMYNPCNGYEFFLVP